MNPITWILRVLIKIYKWFISPVLPGSCRFYPSCSSYTLEAINTHGPFKGSWLGMLRIARCQPWNAGGYDPVPKKHQDTSIHDHTDGTHRSCSHTKHSA